MTETTTRILLMAFGLTGLAYTIRGIALSEHFNWMFYWNPLSIRWFTRWMILGLLSLILIVASAF